MHIKLSWLQKGEIKERKGEEEKKGEGKEGEERGEGEKGINVTSFQLTKWISKAKAFMQVM